MADLGGDLQETTSTFGASLNDATENYEKLMDRWLQEPHGSQWPPLDPERPPAGIPAPEQVHLYWRYKTGGSVDDSPAVADGAVYVGSEDGYVYGVATGS